MNIGIVCYASVGGSGAVAAELAKCLARRGHEVHVISSEPPFRLGDFHPAVRFHTVQVPGYPLFREPQYLLALANTLVRVSREHNLDIIHAHYAIPHAAAAYLAKQILSSAIGPSPIPTVITTLHGTDITLLGSDPSYSEAVAFCIDQSDGVTSVSESLKADTYQALPVRARIRVIPNFLDCEFYGRKPDPGLRERFCPRDRCQRLVSHVSNFRPVKRIEAVVEVFRRIREKIPARLLLVGEGPESPRAARLIRQLGLAEEVDTIGEQQQVTPLLSIADLFLLPSAQESFGLAALEAMACGVPVVASRVGGLPEVVENGVTGFLHPPEDLDAMAASSLALLSDPVSHRQMANEARRLAIERFSSDRIVPQYEAYYEEILSRSTQGRSVQGGRNDESIKEQ